MKTGADGRYELHRDAVFQFLFHDVFDLQLEGFNQQNVITALNLTAIPDPLTKGAVCLGVELEHCYLFDASFKARSAELVELTPWENA